MDCSFGSREELGEGVVTCSVENLGKECLCGLKGAWVEYTSWIMPEEKALWLE